MIKNLEELEQSIGLEAGALQTMISSEEEHNIDLSTKVILDKEVYDERIDNIKRDSANTFLEMSVKKVKQEQGLEFQGRGLENLLTAFKAKVEAETKVEPEERYKNLKTDFEKVQANLQSKEEEFTSFKTNIEKQNLLTEIKNDFTKHIPDNTLVSKSTIFTEAKEKGFSFEKEDGKTVVKDASGNILKNESTLSPVSVKEFVTNFITPYLATPSGGSGAGDAPGASKAGSFEAFEKEAEKAGWTAAERNQQMMRRVKEGTLKI
jgi:hypothetical protein